MHAYRTVYIKRFRLTITKSIPEFSPLLPLPSRGIVVFEFEDMSHRPVFSLPSRGTVVATSAPSFQCSIPQYTDINRTYGASYVSYIYCPFSAQRPSAPAKDSAITYCRPPTIRSLSPSLTSAECYWRPPQSLFDLRRVRDEDPASSSADDGGADSSETDSPPV